jgi:hypothetical protein
MTLSEVKKAIRAGKIVLWRGQRIVEDKTRQWLIIAPQPRRRHNEKQI